MISSFFHRRSLRSPLFPVIAITVSITCANIANQLQIILPLSIKCCSTWSIFLSMVIGFDGQRYVLRALDRRSAGCKHSNDDVERAIRLEPRETVMVKNLNNGALCQIPFFFYLLPFVGKNTRLYGYCILCLTILFKKLSTLLKQKILHTFQSFTSDTTLSASSHNDAAHRHQCGARGIVGTL